MKKFTRSTRFVILLFVLTLAQLMSYGQLTTTIGTGVGGNSYLYAPVYTFGGANLVRTVRIAYIYPSSLLTGLNSGQNITALEWFRNNATGALNAGATWKIYIKNTSANDWGAGTINWADAIAGANLVYDGDPQTFVGGAVSGWRMINLTTPFTFNVGNGGNLAIMCEYIQPGPASSTTTINWNYDNTAQIAAYVANQVKYSTSTTTTPSATLASSTSIHPQIRISYSAPVGLDAGLTSFPSIPAGLAPGVIPVTARAQNFGGTTLTAFTINWQLDGVTQTPFSFSGTLLSTRDTLLTLGSPNIGVGVHTLKAWTSAPNGGTDLQALNDTITKSFTVCNPLSGTYTLNATLPQAGTNFQNFASFTDAAKLCGLSGPVTLNVDSNTYVGKVSFENIATTATNTITINGNKARILHTSDANDPTSYVVQLRDVNYITLNNFTFELGATSTKGAVVSMGNANNNTIKNCRILGDLSGTATTFAGIAVSGSNIASTTATNAKFNIIEDNEIVGGYYGIAFTGTTATTNVNGNIIRRNKVRDFYFYGIWNAAADSTEITSNEVYRTNRATVTTSYGIFSQTNSKHLRITKNICRDFFTHIPSSTSTAAGIFFSSTDAPVGTEALVANNVIYNIGNNGTNYGIQNTGSDGVNIYHNTIQLEHPTATAGIGYGIFQTTAATRIDIRNNNIYVNKGGTGNKASVFFATTTSTITCNYNNLFTSQSSAGTGAKNTGYWGTAGFLTLPDWQLANTSAFDQNSVTADPLFSSSTILRPNSAFINNIGTSISAVADDITGAARPSNPDPGAYEFTPATEDAGVTAIISPVEICPGTANVIVRIKNFGLNTLSSVNVNWTINGVAQAAFSYIGAINSGADSVLNIGSFTTAVNTVYNIKVWTSSPNSTIDANAANDTLNRNNLKTGLSGVYTLGGVGANFSSFTALAAELNSNGLCGPTTVVVNPAAGPYLEQFSLGVIKGASATNTLRISGKNATLQFASNLTGSRHVIQLNGTDFVTIDSLNIVGYRGALTTFFSWGIHLTNGADFNSIRNCKIYVSDSTTSTNFAGVVLSGSNTSATTVGNGRGNSIINNEIYGGYYGVALTGTSGAGAQNRGNIVSRNRIRNPYLAGVYNTNQDSLIVHFNDIASPNRLAVTTYYGVYCSGVTNKAEVFGNKIHDYYNLVPTTTSTSYGIFTTASDNIVGSETIIANNDIYNVFGNGAQYGLYNSSSDGIFYYHNTIALNNPSSTAGLSYGFYQVTLASNIALRNNSFDITRAGSGAKVGLFFATATTTASSDYNSIFVNNLGSVGSWNAVTFPTIATWRTANGGIFDLASIGGNPNVNGRRNNIPQTGSPLLLAGTPIAAVGADLLGNARSSSTPTIGAYEISGDFSGPNGAFVPVLNTASIANYALPNFVTLSDPAGVDTSVGNRPRLYFKKSIEANTIAGNTSASNGWKYVLASNTTSPFSFTIDYSLLNTAIDTNDVIQYFVVARDLLGNVSAIGAELAEDASSINLPGSAFPATVLNAYRIGIAIQGTINVGPQETYKTLTANGGVFEYINNNLLGGNVNIIVKGNLAENGVHGLNAFNETGGSNFAISITPFGDTLRTISGAFVGGLIRLNGADRVTIDGRSNGAGSFIRIENTTATTGNAAIQLISLGQNAGCTDITLRNLRLAAGTSTGNSIPIHIGGLTIPYSPGASHKRITILNDSIERGSVGIYAGAENGFEVDSLSIENNIIGSDITARQIRLYGTALEVTKNTLIKNNIIKNIINTGTNVTNFAVGMALYDGFTNGQIIGNKIERVAGGGGASGGRGIEIISGKQNEGIVIANNFIGNITGPGSTVLNSASNMGIGIINTGGVNVYYNSINLAGTISRTSTGQIDTSVGLYIGRGSKGLNIVNNSIVNSLFNASDTAVSYAWFSQVGDTSYNDFNYNNFYVGQGNAQGQLGYFNGDLSSVSQIAAAITGKNANSISGNPNYISLTDLHAQGATLFQKGVALPGITNDIDGNLRGTPPSIGADEFTPAPNEVALVSILYPTPFHCGKGSDSVRVVLQNLGTNTQSNFNVSIRLSGIVNDTLDRLYIKTLGISARDTFTVGSYNSNIAGFMSITAISELASDQFKGNDTTRVTVELSPSPAMPTANDASVCKDEKATLVASNGSTVYRWFDAQGNLLAINDTLITPSISASTKYYVTTASGLPTGSVKISEIDIGGTDMIEIMNLSAGTVNTAGWKVIVSNSYTDINNVNTIAWNLPATMNAGQVLYRTDATADNYWGNNLFWNPGAFPSFTGWAIILDQNNAVVDAVFMNWPATNISAANIQFSGNPVVLGTQWTGAGIDITTVAATSSVSRAGNLDNNNRNDFVIATTSKGVVNPSFNLPFVSDGCSSDLKEVNVTVLPKPTGSTVAQAAPFQGQFAAGTLANPDQACAADTLSYQLTAPTGFQAADVGITWTVLNPTIKRLAGSLAAGTTSINGLVLRFVAANADEDSILVFTADVVNIATGCDSQIVRYLKVNKAPVVNLGPNQVICENTTTVLDAGVAGASYLWSTGATTQTITVGTAGTYTVTVTNAAGCSSSDDLVVITTPSPVANLGADKVGCVGDIITLDAGVAGASYLWSTGATTQTISVNASGNYSVAISIGSCEDRDTVAVVFNALPVVNLGADRSSCISDTITLDAGNAGSTYLWSTGATTQTIRVNLAGTYSVTVTNANGCVSTDAMVITNLPAPDASFAIVGDTLNALQATFNAVQIAGNQYQWNFGDPASGSNTSSLFNPVHVFSDSGTYVVTLTVTNVATGCKSIQTANVTVPFLIGTGLTRDVVYSLSAAPNPFVGNTKISYELAVDAKEVSIEVYDVVGRQVASILNKESQPAGKYNVDFDSSTGSNASGVYLVKLIVDGNVSVIRILDNGNR